MWVFLYIIKNTCDIINEFNPLFRFPIWVIGKEVFTGAVTVPKLYLSLCVIHWFICSFYAYMCIYYAVGRYDLRIESRKGRKKHAEDVPQQHWGGIPFRIDVACILHLSSEAATHTPALRGDRVAVRGASSVLNNHSFFLLTSDAKMSPSCVKIEAIIA